MTTASFHGKPYPIRVNRGLNKTTTKALQVLKKKNENNEIIVEI